MQSYKKLFSVNLLFLLTACGIEPSTDIIYPHTKAQFVDDFVHGLAYESNGGNTHLTDTLGSFNGEIGDVVTFYLGGKDGLQLGSGTYARIMSPFEITANLDQAINLGILLQSLDNKVSTLDTKITIPDYLQNVSSNIHYAELVRHIDLNNRQSVNEFLTNPLINVDKVVSPNEAAAHLMQSLTLTPRGEDIKLSALDLSKTVNVRVEKGIQWTAKSPNGQRTYYVRGDRYSTDFETTKGLSTENITMSLNGITIAGGATITESQTPIENNSHFILNDIASTSNQSQVETWEQAKLRGGFFACINTTNGCTTENLAAFTDEVIQVIEGQTASFKRVTRSSSYEPTTQLLTVHKIETLCETPDKNSCNGATVGSVEYSYLLPATNTHKVIDFTGTWEEHINCGDLRATTLHTFTSNGVARSGTFCNANGNIEDIPSGDMNTYTQLAAQANAMTTSHEPSQFWFLHKLNSSGTATLSELNTITRACANYGPTTGQNLTCDQYRYFGAQYLPAGKNWDGGILRLTQLSLNSNNQFIINTRTLKKQITANPFPRKS